MYFVEIFAYVFTFRNAMRFRKIIKSLKYRRNAAFASPCNSLPLGKKAKMPLQQRSHEKAAAEETREGLTE